MGKFAYEIGDKQYIFGKVKSTGNYGTWAKKAHGWKLIHTCDTFEGIKKYIAHLKKLADKREERKIIADMCGTSYKAAMEDMGI